MFAWLFRIHGNAHSGEEFRERWPSKQSVCRGAKKAIDSQLFNHGGFGAFLIKYCWGGVELKYEPIWQNPFIRPPAY